MKPAKKDTNEKRTDEFYPLKAVYSYFFPEVRNLMHVESQLPDELFLTTTHSEDLELKIGNLFKKKLELPKSERGYIDLDKIHEPIIDEIVNAYENLIPELNQFNFSYPMAGSSQGIFHALSKLKTKGINEIYVLRGEYEGYAEYGKTLGIKTIEIDPNKNDISKLKQGYWFISNPSARDGNIINNEFINNLCDAGHKVYLDLAYVGLTHEYKFDVSNKNIEGVFLSFSKPYGVFRFRTGGFTFSRKPIDSLYANKWFKDVPSLFTALKIVEEITPGKLYSKYKEIQNKIIDHINNATGLELKPSDSFLLAYLQKEDTKKLSEEQMQMIGPYKRGDNYRFCLTPYFEKYERGELKC